MRTVCSVMIICLLWCPSLIAHDQTAASLEPVEAEVTVRGTLASVWDGWTTNAGAEKWFAPKSKIELKVGGPFEILFAPDQPEGRRGAEDLRILSFVPQEMLSFEWNAPPQFTRARP